MRLLPKMIFLIVISLSLSYCGFNDKTMEANSNGSGMAPLFKDDGKTIDSLKGVYRFKEIEYENWEDDDAVDSSLTVSFINSEKMPAGDLDANAAEFNGIARSIRNSIAQPAQYKSYYIIFVKKDGSFLTMTKVHSTGMDVTLKEP